VAAGGSTFEGLWFNNASPPLDDPRVREALLYAMDRQAVIDEVVTRIDPGAHVLNCGFVAVPGLGPWCATSPFEEYDYDPSRARQILESDGYDCSDTPCARDGKPLVIDYATVSTNAMRIQIQELLKQRASPAGFELRARNADAGTLFGDLGPRGQFTMAEYAVLAQPDPTVTDLLACHGIPTQANGYVGANWTRWCNREGDALMAQADTELDADARLRLMQQLYALEAGDALSLPLFTWPDLAAWRTDRIVGPIGDYLGTPYGLFFNMDRWSLARP
jgi:peptide/nickel transport system substrate-binding protein